MCKTWFWRIGFILLLGVLSVSTIAAQVKLDATYTSPNGSFTFSYPDYGLASVDKSHVGSVQINVRLFRQDYNINVFLPWMTQMQFDGIQSLESARNLLIDRMGANATTIEINTVQSYRMLEFVDMTDGSWVVIELGEGRYGMVSVHTSAQRPRRCQSLARAIALSYSYSYPVIQAYDSSWDEVITELQQRQIIGEQGSLVFSEPDLQTEWGEIRVLDEYEAHTNVVMSARITVTGNAQCGLMAHLRRAAADNSGDVFSLRMMLKSQTPSTTVGFSDSYGVTSRAFDFSHIPVAEGSTHFYLLVVNENNLSIYVDGNPLIEHVPVAPVAGYYGLYLNPLSEDSGCSVSDFWVFEHDAADPEEVCQATIISETGGRLSPYNERVIRMLEAGETIPVVCHYSLETGATWYLLENGAWIEPSKVRLSGNCANLATIF